MGMVPPFLNSLAVFAHKHALALAHASRGGKCKRRGSPPVERSGSGVEGAERSGGLHKRSTAKRGRLGCLLRAPGTESLRRSGFLAGRGAQEMLWLLSLGWALRAGKARRGGAGSRLLLPTVGRGKPPPPTRDVRFLRREELADFSTIWNAVVYSWSKPVPIGSSKLSGTDVGRIEREARRCSVEVGELLDN
jgi:hypothetical protein